MIKIILGPVNKDENKPIRIPLYTFLNDRGDGNIKVFACQTNWDYSMAQAYLYPIPPRNESISDRPVPLNS